MRFFLFFPLFLFIFFLSFITLCAGNVYALFRSWSFLSYYQLFSRIFLPVSFLFIWCLPFSTRCFSFSSFFLVFLSILLFFVFSCIFSTSFCIVFSLFFFSHYSFSHIPYSLPIFSCHFSYYPSFIPPFSALSFVYFSLCVILIFLFFILSFFHCSISLFLYLRAFSFFTVFSFLLFLLFFSFFMFVEELPNFLAITFIDTVILVFFQYFFSLLPPCFLPLFALFVISSSPFLSLFSSEPSLSRVFQLTLASFCSKSSLPRFSLYFLSFCFFLPFFNSVNFLSFFFCFVFSFTHDFFLLLVGSSLFGLSCILFIQF